MGTTGETKYGSYTYEALEREPYWPIEKLRVSITGAGGFIASHIAPRLKTEGHYIIASDWKKNEHIPEDMFCHEFHLVDLRVMDNCLKVTEKVDHVFNLAADMGGMGFIQSNHSIIMYNNTMISFNMLEAARISGVKRFFYASSACIYPEFKQLETNVSLKEADAWPAEKIGNLSFDKDDHLAVEIVTATANIRSASFGIPLHSLFEAKGIAGNIVHAVATTNAIIAGLIVVEAIKVLQNDTKNCRMTYCLQHPSRKMLLMPVEPFEPNKSCYVCSETPLSLELNLQS